jgi:hypothetical protein
MRAWDRFWFQPASPTGLTVARTLVAANTLWILLSRRDLPDIVSWPPEFWASVDRFTKLRFMVGALPVEGERAFYALLYIALVGALVGVRARVACLVSGVLLYHFAPLEEIFVSSTGPYFGGTTLPTLALLVFALPRGPDRVGEASSEYRWPVRLVQVLLTCNYLLPGYAKLFYSGLSWMTADNIRESLYLFATWGSSPPPWAAFVARQPLLCWLIALATIPMELLFPLVLFSPTAARIQVPLMLLVHLVIIPVFGLFFFNMPLLLIFVDWDAVRRRFRAARSVMRRERGDLGPPELRPGKDAVR